MCAKSMIEAGLTIDPAGIQLLAIHSASDGTLIIVGQAPPLYAHELAEFVANDEAGARTVIRKPQELAWPLHTQAVHAYFALRGAPPIECRGPLSE